MGVFRIAHDKFPETFVFHIGNPGNILQNLLNRKIVAQLSNAATPWRSTRSLFLGYRAPYVSRPVLCAIGDCQPPDQTLNAFQVPICGWKTWRLPSSCLTFLWVSQVASLLSPVIGTVQTQDGSLRLETPGV